MKLFGCLLLFPMLLFSTAMVVNADDTDFTDVIDNGGVNENIENISNDIVDIDIDGLDVSNDMSDDVSNNLLSNLLGSENNTDYSDKLDLIINVLYCILAIVLFFIFRFLIWGV